MSPDIVGLAITAGFGIAISAATAVYAKTRDVMVAFYKNQAEKTVSDAKDSIELITKDRDHWQGRHEDDRKEIHAMREQWNYDKLELERLRAETNFTPIDTKLNAFMEGQNRVNNGLMDRMDKMTMAQIEMTESFKRQSDIFVSVVERLVPALTTEEKKNQEKELHEE